MFLAASFGGVSFRVTSLSGRAGRDVVVKSPARGDAHVLQDRGLRHRAVQCEIIFCDEPGAESSDQRFYDFQLLANEGLPEIFTHPIDGSYLARVTDFEYAIRADDGVFVAASCTFLEDREPSTVVLPAVGASPYAGLDEVAAAVEAAEAVLRPAGIATEAPRSILDSVTRWTQAETADTRAVYLETAALSQRISEEVTRLEMLTTLERWPVYREFVNLNYQLRRAADAATSEADGVRDLVVENAMPLRLLCAQIYGAADAEDKARQIALTNRVRTPGLVPAGTVLKIPQERAR